MSNSSSTPSSATTTSLSSPTTSSPGSTSTITHDTSPSPPTTSSSFTSSVFTSSSTLTSSSVILSTSTTTKTPTTSSASLPLTVVTSTSTNIVTPSVTPTSSSASAASTTSAAGLDSPSNQGSQSTAPPRTIAIATVVPIVSVVLLVLAAIWFWRKRKDRKNNAEMRRKEMEEYGFNPNHDPTLPVVGSANDDEPSTMRERDPGYRGWGTTSTTRKASTTMSSKPGGITRSESSNQGYNGPMSPSMGAVAPYSDGHSGDPLVQRGRDEFGAFGPAPATSGNRRPSVNREPSNASSTYSRGNYSDVSVDGPLPHDGPQDYGVYSPGNESSAHHTFNEGAWVNGNASANPPIIRDVSARHNTRIEGPSPSLQPGNSGIAQNF